MIEIYPRLFIGDETDYEKKVKHKKGWWIVHACKEPYHRQLLGYKGRGAPKEHPEYLVAERVNRLFLNMVDAEDPDYIRQQIIDAALEFIHKALQMGESVLVHCNLGESRSPSIGLLYLVTFTDVLPLSSLEEAEVQFRKLYPKYSPKQGIRCFLSIHWAEYLKRRIVGK